jgi:hypothetical protein
MLRHLPPQPTFQRPALRLVTWNCAMALRNKWDQLAALAPDVAVIQECETPDRWPQGCCTAALWHGDNRHKGLAVITFGPWRLEPADQLDGGIEYVLPARVLGPIPFRILGVWTKPSIAKDRSYVGQILHAAAVYGPWLAAGASVVAGDWNSNAQWDKPHRARHAQTVARLADCGLASAYHHYHRCAHGGERHGTWFNHKRPDRAFHLDYCFIPTDWLRGLRCVAVGTHDYWLPKSDHCPVSVDLDLPGLA